MALGGRSISDTIQLANWLTLVPETRGAARLLMRDLADLAGRIESEADALVGALNAEGINHAILGTIRRIIATRATHIHRILDKA